MPNFALVTIEYEILIYSSMKS